MTRLGLGLFIVGASQRPVPTEAPVNTVAPSFATPLTQGQTVAINPGSWTGLPSGAFEYMRQRWNGSAWVDVGSFSSSPNITFDASDVSAGASGVRPAVRATNVVGPTTAYGSGVTIAAPLAITGTPGAATVGTPYSFTPVSTGGHTPKTYALTGTLLSGLSFSTSTGAITGTPTSSGTASGLNITVTDADGLTAALGTFSLTASSSSPPAGPAIVELLETDHLTGMGGFPITPYGGANWTHYKTGTGVTTSPFAQTGQLRLAGTTANHTAAMAVITPPSTAASRAWIFYADPTNFVNYGVGNSGIGQRFILQALEVVANSSYQFIRFNYLGGTSITQGGIFNATYSTSGAIGDSGSGLSWTGDLNSISFDRGDTLMIKTRVAGAQVFLDLYHNGIKFGTGTTDIAALGLITNDSFGVSGYGSTTQTRLRQLRCTNLATESDFWLIHGTHISQTAFWDTGADPTAANVNLTFEYSGATVPSSVTYTVYDVTVDGSMTPVVGLIDLPLSHTAGLTAQRKANLKLASPPAKYVVGLKWPVVIQGNTTFVQCFTPVLSQGEKLGLDGQSRVSRFYQNTLSGVTYTAPTNGWSVDASHDGSSGFAGTVAENRRTQRLSVSGGRLNTARGHSYAATIAAGHFGHANVEIFRSGVGGNDQQERSPSSLSLADCVAGNWDTFMGGVRRATDIGVFYITDHAFEANNAAGVSGNSHWGSAWTDATQIAKWKSIIYRKVEEIEAEVGHPILVVLAPPMTVLGTTSKQRVHDFELMLAQIIASNGDGNFSGMQRFVRGVSVPEYQHTSGTDVYHGDGTVKGMGLQGFRLGRDWARVRGVGPGALGPDLVSAANLGGGVIRCTYNANGATTAVLRGDTATTPHCNHEFNTATDFGGGTALVVASVGTPSAVASGQFTVDFTLTTSPAGTVYVKAPWGQNPYNPANNGTINGDVAGLSVAITGDFGDAGVGTTIFNPPVEPLAMRGLDYIATA